LLSVGNLIELKGHDFAIRALEHLPECELMIVGEGDLRESLQSLAGQVGVAGRVRFLGAVPQSELVDIYNASDMLVLASSNEGMPNVVLESLACGTPVVATNVGGIPEVVCSPEAGVVVQERDVESIVTGIRQLLRDYPGADATRAYAENFSWKGTVSGLCELANKLAAHEQP
jgi:glycosyltransferase involved in cell wall biosynthesis